MLHSVEELATICALLVAAEFVLYSSPSVVTKCHWK